MVDTTAKYHLETLPNGRQVFVNDRTGNIASVDASGRITGEISRAQALAQLPQYPPGVTNSGGAPGTGGVYPPGVASQSPQGASNTTYPRGVTNSGAPQGAGGVYPPGVTSGGAPQQNGPSGATYPPGVTNQNPSTVYKPGVYVPPGGNPAPGAPAAGGVTYPPGVTNTSPAAGGSSSVYVPPGGNSSPGGPDASAVSDAGPSGPALGPAQVAGPYDNPGSDLYDWYAVNDALKASNMGDGSWRIAGSSHQPVASSKQVANPGYNKSLDADENAANGQTPFITEPGNDYTIGVANQSTGQIYKVHFSKSAPDSTGKYSYALQSLEDEGKIDNTTQPGYKDVQQLALKDGSKELWGTNTRTGAFEKMPASPPNLGDLKGWNDVKQVNDGQGHQIWVGTDPTGKPMQPIPGAPSIAVDKYVPGSVKQVTKTVNGVQKQVYVGQNAQTQAWEDIPELGSTPVAQTTTSVGKNVYTTDANGQLVLATAIAQPKENDSQWVDAGTGYAKKQIFQNGDWHDDPDTPQKAVNPATQRANAALPDKGTKIWQPLSGSSDTLVQVTADGNGGFTYDLGPNGEAPPTKKIPGARDPTTVTPGSAGDEFLPQRRDPITQQLLPTERNANWRPTSPADRVRQLQLQATQKQQDLHSQVLAGQIDEPEADKQFSQYWDQNIEPAKQELQLAQQYKTQDENRQNLQIAQANVSPVLQAQSNQIQVGPGFGDLFGKIASATGQGKFVGPISGQEMNNALVYDTPDYAKQAESITAQALAHISPTAANIAGGGTPTALQQPQDITASLNRTAYQHGGMPPQAPGGGGGAGLNNGSYQPLYPQANAAGQPANVVGAIRPYGAGAGDLMSPEQLAQLGGTPNRDPGFTGAVTPTPDVPQSQYSFSPQAANAINSAQADQSDFYQQMAADRARQIAAAQSMIPSSWNAWGQYKPAF